MRPHSIGGMNRFIVKTFQIDRIRAVNCDLAIVDVRRYGSDKPKILVFVITGSRRRKNNQRQPALVAGNKHLKLAA
jgi:hypothetical protein